MISEQALDVLCAEKIISYGDYTLTWCGDHCVIANDEKTVSVDSVEGIVRELGADNARQFDRIYRIGFIQEYALNDNERQNLDKLFELLKTDLNILSAYEWSGKVASARYNKLTNDIVITNSTGGGRLSGMSWNIGSNTCRVMHAKSPCVFVDDLLKFFGR